MKTSNPLTDFNLHLSWTRQQTQMAVMITALLLQKKILQKLKLSKRCSIYKKKTRTGLFFISLSDDA
ncbi:MAG: hypothetical protein A3G52_04940 [Candidatus Taylorbacteria bacterium RIFCSPLOWO2_12_FULL_43_20]|uniref:Uncharacterized protein n=1 Tax=Candidatus Taylorbacteria bacterium RIFCSPLOWO2_12_FULL_43_20 TaxID=1802332 RepID=A0A1G2NZB1_9BACT|nr:MAG: hypothetical protein A2825_03410 [Candidatus Taylorbacteria bacterium RIFCSPHIGHO2_01_FULL_43_120]OHA23760.1 MAG: hypothetical protein A3B98_02935 [Candidatus Taylorbacteria bacterium RIFCSPHIGHO2_02_FULL_43_55]OHA30215.1 MAG: hypothetical protein A3E92_01330 [Candidatus Taylorbacteria bacterium RIFCSPHIGHO2_12_FULL_42_34]OHA31964.1 MAG: hypothetical protein A3B09_01090 [Candidatus Taylorbacteria bacterium RIFCSPLOWO2_01_FULL_43_83]OHA37987.1 MAG: hypothetical protein A3H58_01505 [Candi